MRTDAAFQTSLKDMSRNTLGDGMIVTPAVPVSTVTYSFEEFREFPSGRYRAAREVLEIGPTRPNADGH